ncbi:hypothetical protein F383_33391 [Gossypium arboreum]|uniref:Uncharacterized protein n=1 Tax=Gossypium arboreum TaxID=29729 RepID=A0A0B0PP55_GOSAR|nr:hypothetical protein F383_33391 [Gossypium arboreum]
MNTKHKEKPKTSEGKLRGDLQS